MTCMKRLLPAVAVLLLAGTVTLLILLWREVDGLRAEVAELKKDRGSQRSRLTMPAGESGSAKKSPGPEKAAAPRTSKEEEKSAAGVAEFLMGGGKDQIEKRSAGRLALLKQRLNLRPEQLVALEKHIAAHNACVAATFDHLNDNTGRPPDMGVFIDWVSGRFDLPVKSLLDADQAKLFEGFEAEDRANRIENMVNMELVELHGDGAVQLTSEQKDKVFAALTGILTEEDDRGAAYFADDGRFSARIDESLARRREALQSILDASQMESYIRVLDGDRASVKEMFPSRVEAPNH
jgi:hypothetical protein